MSKKLMFTRVARNHAVNGYFPTDEETTLRILDALEPASGRMLLLDPTCGEGAALAEIRRGLDGDSVTYGIEYDAGRAAAARSVLDQVIHGDLQGCAVSERRFGLLWLNPPYGDLASDAAGTGSIAFKGQRRLEKLFYRLAFPALAPDGVLVLIVPFSTLDAEFVAWLTLWFDDLTCCRAATDQYNQVVVLGRRRRQRLSSIGPGPALRMRERLLAIGKGDVQAPMLPPVWLAEPYRIPAATVAPVRCVLHEIEPQQLAAEIGRLPCLWSLFHSTFGHAGLADRRPVREMSQWHLAMALAAGQITGLVQSDDGTRTLLIKGSTRKEQIRTEAYETGEDGAGTTTVTLVDRFVPVIRAIDMTAGSPDYGTVVEIR